MYQIIKDSHPIAYELFSRHYTFKKRKISKNMKKFAGIGETLILLSTSNNVLVVWRKEIYRKDHQEGINCAVFRNESELLSSALIIEACKYAKAKWGNIRLFTFVNGSKIKSTNPGFCFKKAGWRSCGITKRHRLQILELVP
jgi:hypothetical protein